MSSVTAPATPERKVPMKVLCLGHSRTGTMSLRAALKTLGYDDVYHFSVPAMERPDHSQLWVETFKKKFEEKQAITKADLDRIYGDFMAITDSPSVFFYKELLAAYPEAKVVLQHRDVDRWYQSYMTNLWPMERDWVAPSWNPYRWLFRWFLPRTPFIDLVRLQLIYAHGADFPNTGRKAFEEHYESVKMLCKELGRPVLDYDVADGWRPLCQYLKQDIPNTSYPRLNETADFQRTWAPILGDVRREINQKIMMLTVGVTGALSGAIWFAARSGILDGTLNRLHF